MVGEPRVERSSQAQDEEYSKEVTKLHFEFFKHFTTISTAAALIVLALSRDLNLPTPTIIVGLASLGITLIVSVLGMFYVPYSVVRRGEFKGSGSRRIYALFILTAVAFIFGIAWYAIFVVWLQS